MKNAEVAEIFNNIADILEIQEENRFRIRAYRTAAGTIENLSEDIAHITKEKKLKDIPGIGEDLAGKIEEYVQKGKMKFYEDLKKKIAKPIIELMAIPGVGPKTAKLLCDKLDVEGIADLKRKAAKGQIKHIFGIKEKKILNMLRGIDFLDKSAGDILLDHAFEISEEIASGLKKLKHTRRIAVAGSLRRMKETVRDIDILVTSGRAEEVTNKFIKLPQVEEVVSHGPTKSSVITKGGIQVDLRVVKPSNYGSALCYFTGSKSHNIRLRQMAQKKGLKINEYGIFEVKTNKKIAGAEERDIYNAIGLPYVPPELREDRGEIEAALKGRLPRLVEAKDIKGDLHVHSSQSDGHLSIEEIARACQGLGYEYVAITDHSQSLGVAGGLKPKELLASADTVRRLNKKFKKIRILMGAEVDIMTDGRLDYDEGILKELDFVIAAIHSGFKQSKDVITGRVLRALENKHVNMLAHPTGRLLGKREAYEIDMEKVLKAAKDTNTAIEINAFPERLDLDHATARRAKELGCTIAIATDAHAEHQFKNMFYGLSVARRGWLEKKNVLNTLSLGRLLKKIKK